VRPLRYRTALSDLFVAAHGVLAALGALYARQRDGVGDLLDVSAAEALLGNLAVALTVYTYNGVVAVSGGRRGVWPWGIFACRDGRLLLQITEDGQWRALIEVLGDPEWGHLDLFAKTSGRIEHAEAVEALVAAALAEVELEPFLARAVEAGVPTCRLHTPTAALHWEHLRAREAFREVCVPGHGRMEAPASPFRHLAPPASAASTAVPPEQATAITEMAWSATAAPGGAEPSTAPVEGRPAPLHDVRVVDLSWVIAGPMAAMLLGALGAEILKVESLSRVDVIRLLGPFADDREGMGRSGAFNQFNQGKKSVQVDPTTARGRAVLDDLIASADVVLDNMRPGAMARLGFPLEHLQALNPTIVATAMTGFGGTGPEANRQAYGALIEALSGQVAATGMPGGAPTEIPMSLPDPCAAVHTAIAMVAALYRRRAAGQGAVLDMAMIESWNGALPDALLAAAVTGEDPPMVGNRDDLAVPHGVFRCDGDFDWVALSCETDAQFEALMRLIGDEAAAGDPQLATLAGRRCAEDDLERRIEAWTAEHSAAAAEQALLAAGVPAGKVRKMPAIASCPHLEHRAFFTEFEHPELSPRRHAGVPWRSLRRAVGPFSSAPVLGQHTDEVLASIGYDADRRQELRAAGILH
jgi:crotonobetainyl-CoA:carnitine CoA-transferase CaiB-like acyl-CoA transferase